MHRPLGFCFMLSVLGTLPTFAAAQSATFSGTVLSDPDERHLADAEVALPQISKTARSDSAGNFVITGIPAGTYAVLVRRVGFATTTSTVAFHDNERVEADLLMTATAATLDTVKVSNTLLELRLRDFEARRATGVGRFLASDVFVKNRDRRFAEVLLTSIAGLHAVGATDEKSMATARGGSGRGPCYVQIVLDGVTIFIGRPGQTPFDVNSLNTEDVLGVEFYTPANTPARFNTTGGGSAGLAGGPSCGTLVIWRK